MRRAGVIRAAALLALCVAAPAGLARAAQEPARTFEALLAARDYVALGEALEREYLAGRGAAARAWQERRLREGASAYLGFVYSRELMRAALNAPARQQPALREKAALVALYTMAVLTIDGPRCADPSAPVRRSEQLFDLAEQAYAWAAALPRARRERLIDRALELEQATAALRDRDDFICLGGAEDLAEAMQDPRTRVEEKPGGGLTVVPGSRAPARFNDAEEARQTQALARRTIRADLCRMLEQMRS